MLVSYCDLKIELACISSFDHVQDADNIIIGLCRTAEQRHVLKVRIRRNLKVARGQDRCLRLIARKSRFLHPDTLGHVRSAIERASAAYILFLVNYGLVGSRKLRKAVRGLDKIPGGAQIKESLEFSSVYCKPDLRVLFSDDPSLISIYVRPLHRNGTDIGTIFSLVIGREQIVTPDGQFQIPSGGSDLKGFNGNLRSGDQGPGEFKFFE